MTIILSKSIKSVLFAGSLLLAAPSFGQGHDAKPDQAERKLLEVRRIESEIDLMEREVAVYDKTIRENERTREKAKDRADRLKYKVMSEISKTDTTKPHDMTYKEWQLEKAQREQNQATLKLAKAQQSRQAKVLALGEKTKELQEARTSYYHTATAGEEKQQPKRSKTKKVRTKEFKGE